MNEEMMDKIVLAYSGGLDTSCMIKWLQDRLKVDVITYTSDLGQDIDLDKVKDKALKLGAKKAIVEDLKDEFVRDYVFPSLRINAIYEEGYLLATALSRPLIAKKLIEVARKEGAKKIAHGCTGKGNDQVRFEVSIGAIDPELEIIAPARIWEFKSREDEIEYAKENSIGIDVSKESPYSIDRNLWGVSIECGVLEDPWIEPPEDVYQITKALKDTPDTPTYIEIYFEGGIPKELDGKGLRPVELINRLTKIGGLNGIGRVDMVENRLIGIKSREIYEMPAATILYKAHRALESLVLDRETAHFKELISIKYSELIYYGLWYSTLRESLDAFVQHTQKRVTGRVKLKLYKGNVQVIGRRSPHSLYKHELATYDKEDVFDHKAAEGFIKIWGLPYRQYD
ncbi:MAG: argininosuccinate synthase [bacterium]|nr:argininosuccinate synthase [bacterium]